MLWRLLGNKLKKNLVSKKNLNYKINWLAFFTILRKLNINKDHKIHSVFNEISIKK